MGIERKMVVLTAENTEKLAEYVADRIENSYGLRIDPSDVFDIIADFTEENQNG